MNKRILLIEDNAQNRYLARFLLDARGWQVSEAEDGPSGLLIADRTDPAIILLDIQLPGMDGYAVAGVLAHVPIIAVTSYAMPGDREQCLAAGCTGYIEKPIDPERFADEVERYHTGDDT